MPPIRELGDRFLSEEDLDLRNLTQEELYAWWDLFLRQAQSSNDLDADEYSHGVFAMPRASWPWRFEPATGRVVPNRPGS